MTCDLNYSGEDTTNIVPLSTMGTPTHLYILFVASLTNTSDHVTTFCLGMALTLMPFSARIVTVSRFRTLWLGSSLMENLKQLTWC